MYFLRIFLFTICIIILSLHIWSILHHLIFDSKGEEGLWIRKQSWRWIKKRTLKVNHHKEVTQVLAPELVKKLDDFVKGEAAKVIYVQKGYKMLSDFMVLMIDNYYSTQN